MGTKTYSNALTLHEVGLTIERFLVAAYPQTFTAARVDMESLPTGFMDMGAVVEDTPVIRIGREKHQITTGIPRMVQYEEILGLTGAIEFSLITNSFWQAQFMLGNVSTITTVTTIASGSVSTQYYGRAQITNYALMGVADFTNGSQVIHEFPKVSPTGDFEESLRPDTPNMPFAFEAIGLETVVDSCTELVLGKRHYINGDGVECV